MPTTVCSRNEDCANHLKHLCVKTLRPNVRDSWLVWDIQLLGLLQAEGSQSHSWLRLEDTSGGSCSSPLTQAGCPGAWPDGVCTAPRMDTAQPTPLGSSASVSHPHEKLMSCTGKKLRAASVQHLLSMRSVSVLGCCRREGAVVLSLC